MDTLQFLQAILPASGPYYIAHFDGIKPYLQHTAMPSLEAMANTIKSFDAKGYTVYHACASIKAAHVMLPDPKKPGEMKKYYRVAENLGRMKSFWVDIDCGEDKADEGKGYAKKSEARDAIVKFCGGVGLTLPMMVSSGNGLHCYWPLTKDIGPNSWRAVATAFKALLAEHGVLADPTRTADASSILRPAGSTHRKGDPKPVKVLYAGQGEVTPEAFRDVVGSAGVSTLSPLVSEVPAFLRGITVSGNALAEHAKYDGPPSSAAVVAEKCAQLRAMRDTKGCVEYPIWFKSLGIIKHCSEGLALAQEWSSEGPGYSEYATEKKYDDWNTGPATCASFFADNPKGCDGCVYRENDGSFKKTSPIQLGLTMPEAAPAQVLQIQLPTAAAPVTIEIPEKPDGFQWDDEKLVRYLVNKDGDLEWHTLTEAHFYVYGWAVDENKAFHASARLHQPRGGIVEFDIPMSATAAPGDLLKELSKRSIMPVNTKDSGTHMLAYVRDSINKIKAEAGELSTLRAFGWNNERDGFLMGDVLYGTDGSVRKVRLGANATTLSEVVFPPRRGALENYVNAVNFVYAREGMEPLQYAYANAFGSLLTPFSGETLYKGVMFAITGGRTARGKTTVANAALYAFGDAARMTHTKSSTINARYGFMGTHGNMPLLFDEFTDIDPSELSEWAYSISEGRDKSRMQAGTGGVGLARSSEWAMAPYVTANTDLHERLSEHRGNTDAEAMRIIQLSIDKYALPQLDPNQVSQALNVMGMNSGHAGEVFVKHIVSNKAAVEQLIFDKMIVAAKHLTAPGHRYYRAHMACTLAAMDLLCQLGLVAFNYQAVEAFAVSMMSEMCATVAETNTVDLEDTLSRMINGLSPRILSTYGYYTSSRVAPEEVRVYHEVVGRYVIGNQQTDALYHNTLMLSRAAVRNWCTQERVDFSEVIGAAQTRGAMKDLNARMTLTRGTTAAGSAMPCIMLDMSKLDDANLLPQLKAVNNQLAQVI
jgi:hypothetical protein